MKKLQDYIDEANKRLSGVQVDIVKMSPKRFLPYIIVFAVLANCITILGLANKSDRVAYAALLVGGLAFAGIIALVTNRNNRETKKSRKSATKPDIGHDSQRDLAGAAGKDP